MRFCGICKEKVDELIYFETCVGNPATPVYKIILKFSRTAKCKYIEGGVCDACVKDLITYHESVVTAKKIKQKLLEFIENKKIEQPEVTPDTTEIAQDIKDGVFDENSGDESNAEPEFVPDYETEDENQFIVTSNECDECGQVFNDRYSCKIHKQKEHKKGYVCEQCGKTIFNKSSLKRHMFTHGGVKPFECEVCLKRFYFKNRLNEHMAKHSGLKPFKCNECDKCFPNKSALYCHSMMHRDLPSNYECAECGKSYRHPSGLRFHQLQHCGIIHHSCQYCNRTFKTKYNLAKHLKTQKCRLQQEHENEMEIENLLCADSNE